MFIRIIFTALHTLTCRVTFINFVTMQEKQLKPTTNKIPNIVHDINKSPRKTN